MEPVERTNLCNLLVKEFEKLKDEQRARIDFRDKMIFVTLGAIGTVFSFVIEKPDYFKLLLVIPLICIILGWTYLINDEKISALGRYFRTDFINQFEKLNGNTDLVLIKNWEEFQRKDVRRRGRKKIQLLIDLFMFCISALSCLAVFLFLDNQISTIKILVVVCETILILMLAYQFIKYSSINEK